MGKIKENLETFKGKIGENKYVKKGKEICVKVKEDIKEYIHNDPFVIIPVALSLISVVSGIGKAVTAQGNGWVQDETTGLNFKTTHNLTNDEIVELGMRMENGQPMSEALDDMGLLVREKRRK